MCGNVLACCLHLNIGKEKQMLHQPEYKDGRQQMNLSQPEIKNNERQNQKGFTLVELIAVQKKGAVHTYSLNWVAGTGNTQGKFLLGPPL